MTDKVQAKEGQHFTIAHLGEFLNLDQYIFTHPITQKSTAGKLFLKDLLKLTGSEVSINKVPAGYAIPFLHRHALHEEVYIFISGKGQFQVDNEIMNVTEGTVIRVAPGGARAWRNNSKEDLYYLCIQVNEGSLTGESISDGRRVDGPVVWPE